MGDDLDRYDDDPPDGKKLNQTVDRMDQAWPIMEPIIALRKHLRFLVFTAVFFVLVLRGKDLWPYIAKLLGVPL